MPLELPSGMPIDWVPPVPEIDREIARRREQKHAFKSEAGFKRERAAQAQRGGLIRFIRYFWSILEPETELVEGWVLEAICEHLEAVTFGDITRLLINVPPGSMKAIDCNELVMTTAGWKRHGDLAVGDMVFGPDGLPKKVLGRTPNQEKPCYLVEFDDGATVVAADDHLWQVERERQRETTGRRRWLEWEDRVVKTEELKAKQGPRSRKRSDRIKLCAPLQIADAILPIDPYLFGVWLGDGALREGVIYSGQQDLHHFQQFGRIFATYKQVARIRVECLTTRLRHLGCIRNKRIPEQYLMASEDQRWALLQGLMDTDGQASREGWCRFTTIRKELADDFVALACSLGLLPRLKRGKCCWRVRFTPPAGARIFRLERKQLRLKTVTIRRIGHRYVVSVRAVTPRLVNCIQVEGHLYLVSRMFVPTHNSLAVDVFWPAWEWGPMNMAHLRYVTFSYSSELTERDNGRFRALLASERYRSLWGERFTLERTGDRKIVNSRTGWKFASSIGGVSTGERGDRVILDDPHNVKQTESQTVRQETVRWRRESMANRLNDITTSAVVIIMQRLHEEDVSGDIIVAELPYCLLMIPMEFDGSRYPLGDDPRRYPGNDIGWIDPRALDDNGDLLPSAELEKRDGELAWPDRFPQTEVEEMKADLGPFAWAGQYQQSPMPRKGGIFELGWWQIWEPADGNFPRMEIVIGSLDSAFTEKEENDPSGFVVLGIFIDPDTEMPKIMLMHAWRKHLRIHGEEIPKKPDESVAAWTKRAMPKWGLVEWVAHTCRRFKVDTLLIEAKASGLDVIHEMERLYHGEGWGIVGAEAPRDKVSRALAVQPVFSQEVVYAPHRDWAEMVQNEMAMFPKGKRKDLTDAMCHGVKWLRDRGLIRRPSEIAREQRAVAQHRKKRGALYPA